MSGKFGGLTELFGLFTEGLPDGESVIRVNVKFEVGRLAVERWVAGDAEALGVVEDDGGVAMGDVCVEPGKSAARMWCRRR
jgi:hypothetical protein